MRFEDRAGAGFAAGGPLVGEKPTDCCLGAFGLTFDHDDKPVEQVKELIPSPLSGYGGSVAIERGEGIGAEEMGAE